jgi:hypothetical protein
MLLLPGSGTGCRRITGKTSGGSVPKPGELMLLLEIILSTHR